MQTAFKTFQIENHIQDEEFHDFSILTGEENSAAIASVSDAIYALDVKEQQAIMAAKPWKQDPNHFKNIKISALALIKMVMHAQSGGDIEVMGMMQGKVQGDTMIVMDAFALPVEGTETRVNAQAEGYEYMVEYQVKSKEVNRNENVIGWYHSHPGYGCWLSGIDVSTQMLNQEYQEPFVAIVIDPKRTMSSGKVDIGAFRTYPKGHVANNADGGGYQNIPLEKIEDFGVHANSYYPLEISYFKSKRDSSLLEALWMKYWVNTLTSSPLLKNMEFHSKQISDLAKKLDEKQLRSSSNDNKANMVSKASQESSHIQRELSHGLFHQMLKQELFQCKCKH